MDIFFQLNGIYKIFLFFCITKCLKATRGLSILSPSGSSGLIEPSKCSNFSATTVTGSSNSYHYPPLNHQSQDGRTTVHNMNNIQSNEVADAMNSISFLEKLVALKNVADVTYYSSNIPSFSNGHDDNDDDNDEVVRTMSSSSSVMETGSRESSCEYTGRLWFMRNKGIRFRETVRVKNVSTDGSSATVECDTQMMYSSSSSKNNNDSWIDCSKVTCQVQKSSTTNKSTVVGIVCQSELLVPIPLPGLAKRSIRNKIESTFLSAANTFCQSLDETIEVQNNS